MIEALALANVCATWFMIGLIWFVQIVHYPLFSSVGSGGWTAYERRHQHRTTYVVMPPMLVELVASGALAYFALRAEGPISLGVLGGMLVVAAWVSTFAIQVPLHERLSREHDVPVMRRLVASNWVRTALWSLRGPVVLLQLHGVWTSTGV